MPDRLEIHGQPLRLCGYRYVERRLACGIKGSIQPPKYPALIDSVNTKNCAIPGDIIDDGLPRLGALGGNARSPDIPPLMVKMARCPAIRFSPVIRPCGIVATPNERTIAEKLLDNPLGGWPGGRTPNQSSNGAQRNRSLF